MDLFTSIEPSITNLLPYQGEVYYYGPILSEEQSNTYYNCLLQQIEWKPDQAFIFGKLVTTKRAVAWYADKPFKYTYSNITKTALTWTKELLELKAIVEERSGESFNSCLLNLYHNETEGMAWHSDGEKDLKKQGAIASITLGAERFFGFKHKKTQERVKLILQHGSMLIMKGTTQEYWLHRLPPTSLKKGPRINLTFRTIVR